MGSNEKELGQDDVSQLPDSPIQIDYRPSSTLASSSAQTIPLTRSPSRRNRLTYTDRYIPNRNGINIQAAFSLVKDQHPSKPRRPLPNELNFQKTEEANQTFSTLLKAELFGSNVPSAVATTPPETNNTRTINIPPSTNNSPPATTNSNSNNNIRPRTPTRISRSAPVTPNKNLFRYQSRHATSPLDHSIKGRSSIITDSQDDIYSLSPVRMDSQRLLLSPRKQNRMISKFPYKVLDAPDLADDFYLNLVDWGSKDLLAVGLGSSIFLWNAQTRSVERLCNLGHDDKVTAVSWIRAGTHLAVGTSNGLVQIWDAMNCKRIRAMTGHQMRSSSLAWNEHILTSGSRDRTILHRDVRVPDHYIKKLTGHRQEVCGLKWNTDDNQLASGSNDNKLLVWNGLDESPLYKFEHNAAVKALAWNPHQRGLLASGGGTADRRIRFWCTLTGTPLHEIDTGSQVCNLAWSKNSKELVSTHGYSQNQIMVWKYPSMKQVAALTGHTYRVLYLAVSPDGKTIVTGAGDETLRFWNVFSDTKAGQDSILDVFQHIR